MVESGSEVLESSNDGDRQRYRHSPWHRRSDAIPEAEQTLNIFDLGDPGPELGVRQRAVLPLPNWDVGKIHPHLVPEDVLRGI